MAQPNNPNLPITPVTPAQGRLAHWGFNKEATYGTAVRPSGAGGRYAAFISEALETKVEMITPANIVGVYDEGPTYVGLETHEGKIHFNVFPDFFGLLLTSAFGPDTLQAAQVAPTCTPGSSGTLATGNYYVVVAPIFGSASGIHAAAGYYVGTAGTGSAESTVVSVTGPTGSIAVSWTGHTVPNCVGYIVYYTATGGASGSEQYAILVSGQSTTSATITSTSVGSGVFAATPETGANYHQFNPRDTGAMTNSILQSLTMEIYRNLAASETMQYAGAVINKLMLKFGVGKGRGGDMILTAEADVIAKHLTFVSETTPAFEGTQPFRWNQAVIAIADSQYITLNELTVEIDNGSEGIAFIDGTNEIQQIVAKGPRIITISGVMLGDYNMLQDYLNQTRPTMNVLFTGPQVAATSSFFKLMLDVPLFQFTAYPLGVKGPGQVYVPFVGKAKYDFSNPTQPNPLSPMTIGIVNDVATGY
jgi:hypothetical protein